MKYQLLRLNTQIDVLSYLILSMKCMLIRFKISNEMKKNFFYDHLLSDKRHKTASLFNINKKDSAFN